MHVVCITGVSGRDDGLANEEIIDMRHPSPADENSKKKNRFREILQCDAGVCAVRATRRRTVACTVLCALINSRGVGVAQTSQPSFPVMINGALGKICATEASP